MRPRLALETWITGLALVGIALHFMLHSLIPLHGVLALGGIPLVYKIFAKLLRLEVGADVLAGVSIVASVLMGQYLVGAILVLMLAGGGTLEHLATRRASSVLDALARRMPQTAHRKNGDNLIDLPVSQVSAGDALVVLPHELCPVDGLVLEGRGVMDESYLTGEPFQISKAPGSPVLSGSINGESALTIRALKAAADSRYAGIMRVMADAECKRPNLRRLGDQLALWYIPLTLITAGAAWLFSGDPKRFLAVLVVATPCPLLIAIPVAVIGAISLAASRGIIIRNPVILERITRCRTVILDKTGTLTAGKPVLTDIVCGQGFTSSEVLRLAAALERYSRHPLASAILDAADKRGLAPASAGELSEKPGTGLSGLVEGHRVLVAGRKGVSVSGLPPAAAGLECLVLIDEAFAALFRFRDAARPESGPFLSHLFPLHHISKVMLVSGDRESEVRYLAEQVGITEIFAEQSPEQKVAIVREQAKLAQTLFVGDGINDAPALAAATVGVAIGQNSDITSEAAGAVIMTPSIAKLDELIHIGERMRTIALQSAVGGMALSLVGMALAAGGWLTPIEGAVAQEVIDLAAILNAVRVALPPEKLTDF